MTETPGMKTSYMGKVQDEELHFLAPEERAEWQHQLRSSIEQMKRGELTGYGGGIEVVPGSGNPEA